MRRGFGRTILALVVVIVLSQLLSTEVPDLRPDGSNLDKYMLWTQVKSAFVYFIAVTVGAVVARRSFMVPAVVLCIFGWLLAIYVLYEIARAAGPASLIEIAVSTLYGLGLSLASAVLGSMLGRWFYKREFEHASSAP